MNTIKKTSGSKYLTFIVVSIITALIFVIDLIIPEQYNTGLMFFIPVYYISEKCKEQYKTGIIIAISIILLSIGIIINFTKDPYRISLVNRGFEIIVLLISGFIIFKKKHSENKIAANEAFLNQMLDVLPVGLWFYDAKGEVRRGNKKVLEIWEVDETNIPDKKEFKGWRTDGKKIEYQEWGSSRALLKRESSFDEIVEIETFNGTRKSILNSAVPMYSKKGEMMGALVVNQDITDLKRIEDELRISEKKFRDISGKLERSNKELENFAYIASHDLQEPLRMITSYLRLVSKRYAELLDDKGKGFIDIAVDGARRMQQLINDLLKYSRVTTQGQEFKETDLNNVMDEVMSDLQMAIGENRAKINYPQNLPVISADAVQMRQLFQNLITNALKFRNGREPEINIGFTDDGSKCRFSVQDNGIGIKPEFFERIFVIFQRLHEKEKYPGTGIGLSVCKKIVERHGGRIWVESEEGKGTTFYFTINKGCAN